ncbi:alpha/beta fold hydrolase [Bosea sp. BK604]|uniref:alpha/beta fold hydrolase n=1 Tax=Bosea sp. BK604 TaxID=2512180 RepID=UPI001048B174|nr:alpha/beta fold hydrolase [Bosea sp. BK604]TCR70650.1 3-oxoadipate enol-lactonase [Bosea sp. BK604]
MIDYIDIGGISLRYALSGGNAGPTLVLLHEMGGTLETWDHVAPAFTEQRMLRYDMRGCGLSEKITALSFDDLVADLEGLLDALAIEGPLVLAGVAVGAAVAVRYAVRHPERVDGLLLMALATGIPAARREATQALARQIREGGLRERVVSRLPATFPEEFGGDDRRRRSARGRALANDPVSYGAYYDMLLNLDLAGDLARIACPTLVLAGKRDGTRPPEQLARDSALIPGARFEAVVSGHVMPMLTPELVVDRLRLILNQ